MNIILEAKKLNFPLGEYVVVGSGILAALGLREANDLDVAVSEELLKELRKTGEWKEEMRYNKLFLMREGIDVITQLNWEAYFTTIQEAINSALVIDGVPFLNVEETIKFKTAMGREKDLKDIDLLKKYLEKK